MAARPWTPDDDVLLRTLHAADTSIRTMAARLDRTATATHRRLKALGLSAADRTRTENATHAHMADAKARRAALEVALLEDAERLRRQLWQPHTYFDWGGKDHSFDEHTTPEPTPTDKLKLVQAAGAALDRSLKIAQHDADTGLDQAVGMLDHIAAAIAAAADTMPDQDLT